jgi:translation initiation factor IF-2
MAKIKIFELKKLINDQKKGPAQIESKDIQDFLEKNLGIKKTHSSNLEENEVAIVKKHFMPQVSRSDITAQRPAANLQNRKPAADDAQRNNMAGMRQDGSVQQKQQRSNTSRVRPSNQGQNSSQQQRSNTSGVRPSNQGQNSSQQQRSNASGVRPSNQGQNSSQQQRSNTSGVRPSNQGQSSSQQQRSNTSGVRPSNQGQSSSQQQRSNTSGVRPSNQGQRSSSQQQRSNAPGVRPSNNGQYNRQGQRPVGDTAVHRTGGYRQSNASQYGGQSQRYSNQGSNRMSGSDSGNRTSRYSPSGNQYSSGQGNSRPMNNNRPRSYNQDSSRPQSSGGGNTSGRDGQRTPYRGNRQNEQSRNYNRPNTGYTHRPSGGYNNSYNKDADNKSNNVNRYAKGGNKRGVSGRENDRRSFDQQILDQKVAEKNDNSTKRNRDRINKEKSYRDKNGSMRRNTDRDDSILKSKIAPRKGQFIQPKPIEAPKEEIKVIALPEVLTIKELADKMKHPAAALVKKLFLAGKMVSINQEITYEEAEEIALEYDIISEKEVKINEVEELLKEEEEDPSTLKKRPPVVCVMGHVDHGKTSLLDAIRETNVTSREAGGITQAIGASVVEVNGEKITFLDTPGHEAFTSMRMRGAQSTDIAILVVAADDGVMPQTIEAINHAKAAKVQIIVAINKIDKPSANIERVKQELTEYELVAEDWGGDTIFVPVSAHTKEGIEHLLEMVLLTAEMLELKANPDRNARGVVIEAKLDKGRGPVATVLVQKGTLYIGDNVAVGVSYGKVRAMVDDKGKRVKEAVPSTPVEIIGLNEVPDAGEIVMVTDNEKEARNIADTFISQSKVKLLADTKAKLSLDGLFSQIKAGNIKDLNLIIKADVQGSVEAMKQSLQKLSNDEVAVRIIHGGVGAINESDVILASASNAIIIGFNVKPDNAAKETSEREKVDVRLYSVIYNAIDDIEAAMKGLLDPVFEEKVIGHAHVRQTFKASGVGVIAGSYVLDGRIIRDSKVRIYRNKELIHEGELASLKRFQDDVKEVAAGYECGLVFEKYNDIKEEDQVEFYIMVEVPR